MGDYLDYIKEQQTMKVNLKSIQAYVNEVKKLKPIAASAIRPGMIIAQAYLFIGDAQPWYDLLPLNFIISKNKNKDNKSYLTGINLHLASPKIREYIIRIVDRRGVPTSADEAYLISSSVKKIIRNYHVSHMKNCYLIEDINTLKRLAKFTAETFMGTSNDVYRHFMEQ